jgi:hypothetical protein
MPSPQTAVQSLGDIAAAHLGQRAVIGGRALRRAPLPVLAPETT